jgi:hypothetical protein
MHAPARTRPRSISPQASKSVGKKSIRWGGDQVRAAPSRCKHHEMAPSYAARACVFFLYATGRTPTPFPTEPKQLSGPATPYWTWTEVSNHADFPAAFSDCTRYLYVPDPLNEPAGSL